MTTSPFSIETVVWESHREDLLSVRHVVFVQEQKVPAELEEDEHDPFCTHVLARDGQGEPIGTARLDGIGKIGRVAVLKNWRRHGVGASLMNSIVSIAEADCTMESLKLHAQTWTIGFYQGLGFTVHGDEFEEAGISHFAMVRNLSQREPNGK